MAYDRQYDKVTPNDTNAHQANAEHPMFTRQNTHTHKMALCFVCHGNICRSPMAEFVMKDLLKKAGRTDVTVESAALHTDEIGNDIHYGTRQKLVEMKVPFAPRAAWLLTAAKAREYDLLIGMDSYNIADLRRLVYPEDRGKIRRMLEFANINRDVADPWYTGNFDATWDDILAGCTALLREMEK